MTNREDHLREMLALVRVERWVLPFGAENGAELLSRHFMSVELCDATGTVTFADAAQIRTYLALSERLSPFVERVPELDAPLVARRRPVVFVATT